MLTHTNRHYFSDVGQVYSIFELKFIDTCCRGLAAAKKAMKDGNYEKVIPLCTDEINRVKGTDTPPKDAYYEALLLRGTMHLLCSQDTLSRADLTEIIEADSADPKVILSS